MLAVEPAVVERPVAPVVRPWPMAVRITFRFCFIYFGLYVVFTQMLPTLLVLPGTLSVPDLGNLGIVGSIVGWVAREVFSVTTPLVITGSGSGDKTFDWVLAFCSLVISVAGAALWTVAASRSATRGRRYIGLHQWFRAFLRFSLGATFVSYGAVKVVPLQMPYPPLTRLLEPFGHFSPMGVLWYSIGASRPYEIFTGCVELLAGILLFIPATATLGALVGLAASIQIFTLNMTYDVPVKLFSFHLILMSIFLLAPDVRRLLNVLVLNRPALPSAIPPLGRTRRNILIGVIAQLCFGGYIVGMNLYGARQAWTQYGGGAPKSPLYGVWDIEYMAVDGVERAPLITDFDRWRRVIFDQPASTSLQRMDDSFARFRASIDMNAKSLSLTRTGDRDWKAAFSFDRSAADRMVLRGDMDGKKVEMRLVLHPPEKFLLTTRGFNWVQEYPFNR